MTLPSDTLYPSEALYPGDMPILGVFRLALVSDATLLTHVPADNIYAGLRDEKTSIPAVDIFQVSGGTDEPYAGARVGGMTLATTVVQISVFARTDLVAMTIADRIVSIVLSDNTTLNTSKIKNIRRVAEGSTQEYSIQEYNMVHIPLQFRMNYHFTTS